jgi:sulfur-carrier protein
MIRVQLARVGPEVQLQVAGAVTTCTILDALEAAYPVLRGTIRDHGTLRRRAYLRFFGCAEDLSFESPEAPVPAPIATGAEPFIVLGALSGG